MHNVSRHERVRPLLRTRVVLKVIFSVDDGNAVVVAAGGGEEDLRPLETAPRVLLRCDGRFHRWSSSSELYGGEAEPGQDRQH